MEYVKPRDFIFNPQSPVSINEALLQCSNNIAIITELVAYAEEEKAKAESKYKVEYAKAFLIASGSAEKCKSYSLVSEEVQEVQLNVDIATAKAKLLKAHLDGWEALYYAVRKMASNWESENNKAWSKHG